MITSRNTTVASSIAQAFDRAHVIGRLHAIDLNRGPTDDGFEIEVGADDLVITASVFKLPVLVELARQVEAGLHAWTKRMRIGADERRTDGGTGLAVMLDDVDISLRDLAVWMMSVSDNRATDIICDLVGLDRVNATMRKLGFPNTVIEVDCDGLFTTMVEDLGRYFDDVLAERIDRVPMSELTSMRAATPAATDRSTPRETTGLLAAVWRDEVLNPHACAEIRRILGLQVWAQRLTAGFSNSRITVSGKTGTMPFVRNEAGVVEFPDGGRYAVAVFLREPTPEVRNPDADRVIGEAARIAVDGLRHV